MFSLAELNSEQQQAVKCTEGRVLILAGAGSGKTKVLTCRTAHLIENQSVCPENILGLTFTNKAAAEMRSRLSSLVGSAKAAKVNFTTFHSFCMQVLKEDIHFLGYTSKFSLYDETDLQRLLNSIVREALDHEGDLPSMGSLISNLKKANTSGFLDIDQFQFNSKWHEELLVKVYHSLKSALRAYNAVDFDNLLCLTVELFEKFADVLDRYQDRYRYIMIDEYQDTNQVQLKLAELLAKKYNNLCVVGDDDQSIYGWRGAEIKNILSFGEAKVIKMEQNYRSSNIILEAANAVIKNNCDRYPKALWSSKVGSELIQVFHAPDEDLEAECVVKQIVDLRQKEKLVWSDFAILYRSNSLARSFEKALLQASWSMDGKWFRGIPYEVFGGAEFYDRKEVKDILAYMRVISNELDQEALLRIVNLPTRGVGEDSLDKITRYNRSKKIPLFEVIKKITECEDLKFEIGISGKAQTGLKQFIDIIEEAKKVFHSQTFSASIKWLVETINYQKAIRDDVKSQKMRDFKWSNVMEFIETTKAYDLPDNSLSLENFLANTALRDQISKSNKSCVGDKVKLMTFHSSKGLEFKACYLVGIEDHIIPHEKSMLETGVEEERRLMYVAITRAKKFLTISMSRSRLIRGEKKPTKPSRFLNEIPKHLFEIVDWRSI